MFTSPSSGLLERTALANVIMITIGTQNNEYTNNNLGNVLETGFLVAIVVD